MTTYKIKKEKDGWHGYARRHWWKEFAPVYNIKTHSIVVSESPDFWLYVLDGTKGVRLIYEV